MSGRAESEEATLGITELLAWVAGLSAFAGLVTEVVHRSSRESGVALVGGLLVVYLPYIAFSLRAFWKLPRIAVAITLLLGGSLWTFSLQFIDRSDLTRALIATIFIPLATAYAVRLSCPERDEIEAVGDDPERLSLVHSLLDKGKGLGNQSDAGDGAIRLGGVGTMDRTDHSLRPNQE